MAAILRAENLAFIIRDRKKPLTIGTLATLPSGCEMPQKNNVSDGKNTSDF
jgi:hypothetical protein